MASSPRLASHGLTETETPACCGRGGGLCGVFVRFVSVPGSCCCREGGERFVCAVRSVFPNTFFISFSPGVPVLRVSLLARRGSRVSRVDSWTVRALWCAVEAGMCCARASMCVVLCVCNSPRPTLRRTYSPNSYPHRHAARRVLVDISSAPAPALCSLETPVCAAVAAPAQSSLSLWTKGGRGAGAPRPLTQL